jgi:hypothetical protein
MYYDEATERSLMGLTIHLPQAVMILLQPYSHFMFVVISTSTGIVMWRVLEKTESATE